MVVQGNETVLVSRRVLYIGSAVPMETTEGLEAIQQPLRERYPVNDDRTIEGIDSNLLILPGGLQLQYISDPETIIFFPISSLSLCAAVRCVQTVNGATGERQAKFVSLNKMPPGTENSKRPAIFTSITRRTQGRKVLECHGFVCKSTYDALTLVKATSLVDQAHKNNTPIDYTRLLKTETVIPPPKSTEPSMHLVPGEALAQDIPAGPEFFERPPSQGYFYTSSKVEVKKFNVEKISDSASENVPVVNGHSASVAESENHVPPSPRERLVYAGSLPQRRSVERPVYMAAPHHVESHQEPPRILIPPPAPGPVPIPVHGPLPSPPVESLNEEPSAQPAHIPVFNAHPPHPIPEPIRIPIIPPPQRPQVRPIYVPVRVPYGMPPPRPRFFSPPPPLVRPMPMFVPPPPGPPLIVRRKPQRHGSHSSSRSGSSGQRRAARKSSVGSSSGSDRAKTPPRDYESPRGHRLSRKDEYERKRHAAHSKDGPAMYIPPHSPFGYKIQIPVGYKPFIPYGSRARSMPPIARYPRVEPNKKQHRRQHKNKKSNKVSSKKGKNARDDVSTDSFAGYTSEIGHRDIMDRYGDNTGYDAVPRRPRNWLKKENQFMNERLFSERMHQETRKSKGKSYGGYYPTAYELNEAADDRDNMGGDFTLY